jgi:hypothetical protein
MIFTDQLLHTLAEMMLPAQLPMYLLFLLKSPPPLPFPEQVPWIAIRLRPKRWVNN